MSVAVEQHFNNLLKVLHFFVIQADKLSPKCSQYKLFYAFVDVLFAFVLAVKHSVKCGHGAETGPLVVEVQFAALFQLAHFRNLLDRFLTPLKYLSTWLWQMPF